MDNESEVKTILSKLNQEDLLPHPYLKTRILAVARELRATERKLFFWKMFSTLSMACLVMSLYFHPFTNHQNSIPLNTPYVIHMNFNDQESTHVAIAEIQLPQGISFHSEKNLSLREARQLRLPVFLTKDGRYKLPFVVVASGEGTKKIHVRLFDKDNHLVKESFIKVNFNRKS